jgi:hypothetical protein
MVVSHEGMTTTSVSLRVMLPGVRPEQRPLEPIQFRLAPALPRMAGNR